MNLTSCGKDFDFLKSCRAPSQLFTALLLQPSLRQCSLSSLSVSVNIYDLFTFYLPLFSRYLKNNHTERYLSSVISKITSRKMLFREANFAESCWSPICILNEKLGGFTVDFQILEFRFLVFHHTLFSHQFLFDNLFSSVTFFQKEVVKY